MECALKLQQYFRGHLVRRSRLIEKLEIQRREKLAAVILQASSRTFISARLFRCKKAAVSRISSFYRSKRTKEQFVHVRKNAISIQTNIRCMLAKKHYRRKLCLAKRLNAAIILQKTYRGFLNQ